MRINILEWSHHAERRLWNFIICSGHKLSIAETEFADPLLYEPIGVRCFDGNTFSFVRIVKNGRFARGTAQYSIYESFRRRFLCTLYQRDTFIDRRVVGYAFEKQKLI